METRFDSSAPHLQPVAEWRSGASANAQSLVVYRSPDSLVEIGIRRWELGREEFQFDRDVLCYFFRGRAQSDSKETEISPGTLVHFKGEWRATLEITEPLEATYMTCQGGTSGDPLLLHDVLHASPLKDWGAIPTMIEGRSLTSGILLSRGPNGRAESGIWACTPGTWKCEVTADEFCHFLDGSCTYTHESGEQIEIAPDTLGFFPQGWRGVCEVRQTIRKVYMIR